MKANFEDIQGFIFDLDGVITDTARLHTKAWRQVADQVGTPWSQRLQDSLKGISRMESLELILRAGGLAHTYSDEQKEKLATAKNTEYLRLVATLTPADILPGVQSLLDDLDAHGYKMAIASASSNAPIVLHHLGLTHYFPEVVDPRTLHHGKPDPEIFLRAAELIKVAPAHCVGVEDAAAGVAGIVAAGETAIGIGDATVLRAADINFADTSQMTLVNIRAAMCTPSVALS